MPRLHARRARSRNESARTGGQTDGCFIDWIAAERSFSGMTLSWKSLRSFATSRRTWRALTPASRLRRVARRCLVMLTAAGLAACSGGDDGVTVRGDLEGLDSIGLRGGLLLERADRTPALLDSIRAANDRALAVAISSGDGALDMSRLLPADSSAAVLGEPRPRTPAAPHALNERMTARAQARGDSLARAVARQLAILRDDGDRSRADTIRGIVTLIGTEPARQVVLRSGGNTVALSGMATTGIHRLSGNEIVVRGLKVTPRDIVVSDYIVRAADGVPAVDGILEDGATLRLTDGSGRKQLPSVPAALRGMEGTRVWLAFREGRAQADAYGIIPRR